jgi:hypothetical protein
MNRHPERARRRAGVARGERRQERGSATTRRSHQDAGVARSDGFIVAVETSRLTRHDVEVIARRFAARLLAEAEQSGTLSPVGSAPARLVSAGGVTEERPFPR